MLSVICPIYNEEEYINQCIESILMQDYPKNDLEILFVDGMSKDKTRDIVKEYSEKLTNEIGRGYTFSALSRMRQFYLLSEKIATLSQQLTWSHYCELLVFDNVDEINYYIKQTEIYNLSVR